MSNIHFASRCCASLMFLILTALALTGCKSPANTPATQPAAVARPTLRIDAGADSNYTSPDGTVWLADYGADGGDVTTRDADLAIANTNDPGLYRTEHYGMAGYSFPIANGKYTVKLHFAETYDGVTGPGQRVFSFNVQGHEFKDFDVWAKAGGGARAYIETVDVEVTNYKLDIKFTSNIENPEINAIEIIPD
jgi:endoglucanase